MRSFWKYLQKLGDADNSNSSKSFALIVSTITGGMIAIVVCAILLIDVIKNGYVKTNLADLGVFLLCVGGYVAGSGITKAVSEKFDSAKSTEDYDEEK